MFLLSYMFEIYVDTHIKKYLLILVLYSIPSYDYTGFTHSFPKDGHLSHSQFYTIANNMETNIFIHKSPCKCFSRYTISKSRIAGHIVCTFSTFLPYYSPNYLTNYLSHFYEISLYTNI